MSDIDVHEIKLNLRYPNSMQEDITDAFMRGYQGAVKIGNDAVRRVKAEKDALERRIDELCQEVEQLRKQLHDQQDTAEHNFVRNAREYKRVCDENAKLRELASILCFCMQVHTQCDDCKLNGAKGELAYDPLCACDGLHEILRELRIEVPDGKV